MCGGFPNSTTRGKPAPRMPFLKAVTILWRETNTHRMLVLVTILLSPVFALYGLWVYGGYLMDQLGQRRK
jgi:hypothetical protein